MLYGAATCQATMADVQWWKSHEIPFSSMRADASAFVPSDLCNADVWQRGDLDHEAANSWQLNELLVALTSSSSNSERPNAARRQSRGEKTAARRAGMQRLIDVARAAASRADVAETRVAQLEIEVAELRAKLAGVQQPAAGSTNCLDHRVISLIDEFLDRLGCSADFLAPLLARERGLSSPIPLHSHKA